MTFGISSDKETTDVLAKYPLIARFCERLHGSGIDFDWSAVEKANSIELFNAFHCMNDAGYYVTSQSFRISIPKTDVMGFKLTCCDKSRYWWDRNMLAECIGQDIAFTFGEIFRADADKLPIESGFIPETIHRLVQGRA